MHLRCFNGMNRIISIHIWVFEIANVHSRPVLSHEGLVQKTGSSPRGAGDGDRTRMASLEVWMSRTRGQRETPYFD
jgi:hypothetical protein